ncbi:MAG: hypothetical protein HYY84_05120 [Deltaproteobacteria bacterium]|nr:hypothetical protein [Deltaproteobacteria bacterium]
MRRFFKTAEGSTAQLIQLCAGYFFFYIVTGITVKYFTDVRAGFPAMHDMEFLVYSTVGGSVICLGVAIGLRWYRLKSNATMALGRLRLPRELLYIIPSGVCTAVIIPTTTLNYMLLPSVMVAMVITRGSVIVISRAVDAIQIAQGILKKRVYWEENIAVVFALCAVGVNIFWSTNKSDRPSLFESAPAMINLGAYVIAYMVRIYIMNYYKNTRGRGVPLDNKGFFALEQIAASFAMVAIGLAFFNATSWFGVEARPVAVFRAAIETPKPDWTGAVLAGSAYGMVAFFSVFIFMFKGRTATFAGLVNRLTSLVAGTAATLAYWVFWGGKAPKTEDWVALGFILVAVGFLTRAEKKRTAEMVAAHEIGDKDDE